MLETACAEDRYAIDTEFHPGRTYLPHLYPLQPAPAPRFSGTPLEIRQGPPAPGANTAGTLADWGFPKQEVATLLENGAAGQNPVKK